MKITKMKTKHTYSKGNNVFINENESGEKGIWNPINFQWIPVVRLNNELNKPQKL